MISIIIPCYNYGHFLPETLESILNQTYRNWECIVVDDGSIDNTREVAMQWLVNDNRFKYYYQSNKGLSSARNTGISKASGDYVLFLDADDLIETQTLEAHCNFITKVLDNTIIFGLYRKFSSNNDKTGFVETENVVTFKAGFQRNIRDILFLTNPFPVSALLVSKKIISATGFFDESLSSLEDWDYWLRASLHANFYYHNTEKSYTLIRVHPISMSTNNWRMVYNQLIVRLKMVSTITDTQLVKINKAGIESCIKTMLYTIADEYDKNNQSKGIELLTQLYKIYPSKKIAILYLPWLSKHPYLFRKLSWLLFERLVNIISK
jgi:glycosyltransferase involved in cell wall biosynthesis